MKHIPFSNNYKDHSTDTGFRFEFFCEKCHDGYMTEFQRYAIGTINNLVSIGESLFGGIFHQARSVTGRVHSSAWENAKDNAFLEAVKEGEKHFFRCSRCGNYFCKSCWNPDKGLCINCSPFLHQEIESAKSHEAVRQAREHVGKINYVTEEDILEDRQVTCPFCKSPTGNSKFCPECGKKTGMKNLCPGCKREISMSVKFCPECGTRI